MACSRGIRAKRSCLWLSLCLQLSGAQTSTNRTPSAPSSLALGSRQLSSGGQELGPCICDLTRASCDINCCCDPDCDALGLTAGFDCLPAGPANRTSHSCHSKGWLHNVNPRVDFSVVADDLQGLLCVAVDNNVIKGVFHQNAESLSPARIDTERSERRLESFGDSLTAVGPNAKRHPATESRGYQAGDKLMVHRAILQSNSSILPAPQQSLEQSDAWEVVSNMPLNFPDVLGACSARPGNAARFLVDVPPTSCWLGPVQLSSACTTSLNYRSANAWMLRKMHLPETQRCGSRCIKPDVSDSCPWNVTSSSGVTSTSPCIGEDEFEGRAARFVQDSTGCSCLGAVREVKYSITYGLLGTDEATGVVLKSVKTHATLQDIRSEGCQPIRVAQYTSVRFLQEGSTLSEESRSRSGHPGYKVGLPLLAATCKRYDDSDNCVAFDTSPTLSPLAVVEGIRPDGTCVLTSSGTAGDSKVIKFGEDAVFGCSVSYTREQLASICRAGSATGFMDLLQLLPFGRLGSRWSHLAAFGNLEDVDAMEWIDVTAFQGSKALEFDENQASKASTSTCHDAVVGVNLEILYSPFGEVRNPQARIVGARQSHVRGNLHFTTTDPTKTQPFHFYFAVSFVRVDDTGKQEAGYPPKPQLPLWLPHDLFYPFRMGSSLATRKHDSCAWLILVCVLVLSSFM